MTITRFSIAGLRVVEHEAEQRLDRRVDRLTDALLGLTDLLVEKGLLSEHEIERDASSPASERSYFPGPPPTDWPMTRIDALDESNQESSRS